MIVMQTGPYHAKLLFPVLRFSIVSPISGIFDQPTGNVSDKYNTFITPSGWTFIIWAIIYSWMAAGLIYGG